MKKVTLITDGACLGNPGPGGWAALLRFGGHEKLLSGSQKDTTNNQMEMKAVIEGLGALRETCKLNIISDSRYIIDAFEKGWITNWEKNGWRTAQKEPVKNQDLWIELKKRLAGHQITWTWVKGHAGHVDNERVDQAARQAAVALQQDLAKSLELPL